MLVLQLGGGASHYHSSNPYLDLPNKMAALAPEYNTQPNIIDSWEVLSTAENPTKKPSLHLL